MNFEEKRDLYLKRLEENQLEIASIVQSYMKDLRMSELQYVLKPFNEEQLRYANLALDSTIIVGNASLAAAISNLKLIPIEENLLVKLIINDLIAKKIGDGTKKEVVHTPEELARLYFNTIVFGATVDPSNTSELEEFISKETGYSKEELDGLEKATESLLNVTKEVEKFCKFEDGVLDPKKLDSFEAFVNELRRIVDENIIDMERNEEVKNLAKQNEPYTGMFL